MNKNNVNEAYVSKQKKKIIKRMHFTAMNWPKNICVFKKFKVVKKND